jgi:hypothetical protein
MGRCSPETRKTWKERYQYAKKYGIRTLFAGVTGTGLLTIVKEAATDSVKRYIGIILIDGSLTCLTGAIPLVTNATKVLKYSKACHSVCAASWRVVHNAAELPMILVDFAIFGEYVPSCGEIDYDLYSETTDILSEFTG